MIVMSYQEEVNSYQMISEGVSIQRKMATRIQHKIVHADKLAIFTCNEEINERQIRFYVINNWKTLTLGMDGSTFLFIAGVHGLETGKLGPNEYIEDMQNQVITPNSYLRDSFQSFHFFSSAFES